MPAVVVPDVVVSAVVVPAVVVPAVVVSAVVVPGDDTAGLNPELFRVYSSFLDSCMRFHSSVQLESLNAALTAEKAKASSLQDRNTRKQLLLQIASVKESIGGGAVPSLLALLAESAVLLQLLDAAYDTELLTLGDDEDSRVDLAAKEVRATTALLTATASAPPPPSVINDGMSTSEVS